MHGTREQPAFGNGVVGRCLQQIDWGQHELGPIESWPEGLRAALATLLAAKAPMQLLWGPSWFVFYNDACISALGTAHPSLLGRTAADVLRADWETLGPAIERCRTEGIVVEHEADVFTPIYSGGDVGGVIRALGESRDHDDLLALIGHELRDPLAVLSTMIQVLVLRAPSREIDFMARAIAQLTRLIDDVVDVSRLEQGRLTIQRTHVELATVIARAIDIAQPLVDEKQAQLSITGERTTLGVEVDRERVAKAIANGIGHALTQDGSGKLTIESTREGERARIVIRHEGSGAVAEQTRQSSAPALPRNTGRLGFALARSIVDLHGGTLRQQCADAGVDAQCVIELPLAAKREPVVAALIATKKIMLVEDNDDAARALKLALEQLGYAVAVAHNGPIALNLAQVFAPDVVLLDIGLPVMNGWELASRIRDRCESDVTFVAVTARDQEADRERSLRLGFAEHLVKPIDVAELQRIVEGVTR